MHDKHLISIEKSQTLLLNEQSKQLESQGRKLYKFGFGQSPFSPPAFVIDALKHSSQEHGYSSVQGIAPLREAIARFHSTNARKLNAEQIFVAPGSKALLYAIMACYEAVEVLIPAPAWVSYAPQAQMLGHCVTRIPCAHSDRWRVTPRALSAAIKRRKRAEVPLLMILNSPGNPDGLSYSADELKELAKVMRHNQILVISDEIYAELNHQGAHNSLADFYEEGTIVTTGLSKWCGAGGWRLGVAIIPQQMPQNFSQTLLGVASEIYSCAPTPVQHAAIAAYSGGNATNAFITQQRRILGALGNALSKTLNNAGIKVCAPQGGFYLFVDFSSKEDALAKLGIYDSDDLCQAILDATGVVLLPSSAFGMAANHLSARLAYVDFDGDSALDACKSMGEKAELDDAFLQQYCHHTLEGIAALAGWSNALKAEKYA